MRMRISTVLLLLLLFSSSACTNQNMDRQTRLRFEMYMVSGKQLYKKHCANCHQADGNGFARLYPPLNKSTYLLNDIPRAACIIRNGQSGEMVVNGQLYNQPMPANDQLTNLEIAQITTYITNSWENANGYVSVKEIDQWVRKCN